MRAREQHAPDHTGKARCKFHSSGACGQRASAPKAHTPRIPPANLSGPSSGALLELGLGISAWKSNGVDRWAVRCNPSSGNLHPVEAYLVLPTTDLGPVGLYHYEALDQGLELRCAVDLV